MEWEWSTPKEVEMLQFSGTTGRSAKNNNPLNLERVYGSYQDKYGAELEPTGGGKDKKPRFAKFPTMMDGYLAGLDQIKLDQGRGLTLSQFVNKFAPPHENPTEQIISQYAKALGVRRDTPLADIAPEKLIVPMLARESSTKIVGRGPGILERIGNFLGPSSAEAAETSFEKPATGEITWKEPTTWKKPTGVEDAEPPKSAERMLAGTAADVLGVKLPVIDMNPAQLLATGVGGAVGGGLTKTGAGAVAGAGALYGLEEKAMREMKKFGGRPVEPEKEDQFARDFASGAVTQYAGMVGSAAMKPIVQPFAKLTYDFAKGMYEHVLKVPTTVPAAMRDKAVESAMEGYIAVTKRGLNKLVEKLEAYHSNVAGLVDDAAASGTTIERNKLIEGLHDLKTKYLRAKTFTEEEVNAIVSQQTKLIKTYPERIPVDEAQGIKQELYSIYKDAYKSGQVVNAVDKNIGKTVAKEIMIELEKNVPGLSEINKKWSGNLELLKHLERAVNRTRNYETFRLGDIVMTAGQGPEAGFINRVLNNPTVISNLALLLGKSRKATGEMIGKITGFGLSSYAREDLRKNQPVGTELPTARNLTGETE